MTDVRDYPLISVVIPSFNQGHYLEETLLSVIGQHYPNLEILVIDGGSTDATIGIIEKYSKYIVYWHSRKDQGQSDAINQGMRLSSGEILCWLNSDDMYLPCALSKVANRIGNISEPKLVYGGCLRFMQGTNYTYGRLPEPFDPERLTYYNYIDQPSVFWTRALWERVGELDESYHYVMDWDWWIRASQQYRFLALPDYLSIFRLHAAHKSEIGGIERKREILKIIEVYASGEWITVFNDAYGREEQLRRHAAYFSKCGLYRVRYLLNPWLWWKHRGRRLDVVLSMMP